LSTIACIVGRTISHREGCAKYGYSAWLLGKYALRPARLRAKISHV
jgi:hypothetical protein